MIGMNYRVPNVDAQKCHTCRKCLARSACRIKALIQFEPNEMPYVDVELCRGCLACMEQCPFQAIVMQ